MKRLSATFVTLALCVAMYPISAPVYAQSMSIAQCAFTYDETPRVILMTAYAPELEQVLSMFDADPDTCAINGRTYYRGQMSGTDVVLTASGISMVNAAMAAQTALLRFNARALIYTGIAGGVNPELGIGDVVIPAQWAQYLESTFARETEDGWQPVEPYTDAIEPYGMIFPREVRVTHASGEADDEEWLTWFPVDAELVDLASQVADEVGLERCTPGGDCLDHAPGIVVGGNGVSASVWMDNVAVRDWLHTAFEANALDMESAAVSQVAYANDVPFLAIRSLSDLAGGPGTNEESTFFALAAANSATVVAALLAAMSEPAPDRPLSAAYFGIVDDKYLNQPPFRLHSRCMRRWGHPMDGLSVGEHGQGLGK